MPVRSTSRSGTFQARSAPSDLANIQAFVNTRDLEAGSDKLDSPEALAEWLVERRWVEADLAIDEHFWKRTLELRDILLDQFRSHNGVAEHEAGDPVKRLSRFLGVAQTRLSLSVEGRVRFETAETGWPGFLARLLLTITKAVQSGKWSRLKACHEDTCRWIFYDAARNRSAKWCSVQRCGNRINKATYNRRGPAYRRRK